MTLNNSYWACVLSVWAGVWAIRHRGELDHELDIVAKVIRWLIAILGLTVWPLFDSSNIRICIGLTGMLFLVWPNTAYHVTRLLRSLHILPKVKTEEVETRTLT